MIIRSDCPCCKSPDIFFILKATDHTVSHEAFEIWQCRNCSLRFTQAVPDKVEIAEYYKSQDYISHSDTRKGLVNMLYHSVRKRTLLSKRRLIEKYTGLSSGSLLDIGSGTGSFLKAMHEAGWKVSGIEPDEASRKRTEELYGLKAAAPEMLFIMPPGTFDAVTMWHVLEHVHDLHEYIEQLKKIIKVNGYLFIAVPNYTSFDQNVYRAFWAAYDVPRHLYHFSPDAMISLLLEHRLKLKSIRPMYFDSFYISMLSEKYKHGKSNLLNAFRNGLISNYKALKDTEKCSSLIYIVANARP